jgi:hypothetical protein
MFAYTKDIGIDIVAPSPVLEYGKTPAGRTICENTCHVSSIGETRRTDMIKKKDYRCFQIYPLVF